MTDSRRAVAVDGLSKSFRLPSEQVHTLKERVLHPLRAHRDNRFEALKNVSFDVGDGEFFGIVGRNGSGKSTLLKCLAGIYQADGGQAWIDGRLSAFIELGVGFNMDLAARDNIRINAVMLGLSTRDAKRREDEIIDFAGLQGFEDLKIKNYSSGMLVRLGFSIMAHVDADVLLIDEVLAVGDAAFQQKCYDQFARIRREGRTVLLVTHDMGAVERYCDRAMLLDKGEMVAIGEPHEVAVAYLQRNFAEEAGGTEAGEEDEATGGGVRFGDRSAEIVDAWFEGAGGDRRDQLDGGEPATFVLTARFRKPVEGPIFGLAMQNDDGDTVLGASTKYEGSEAGYAAGDEVTVRFTFDNVLAPGRYTVTPAIAHDGTGAAWIDVREKWLDVVVASSRPTGALVDLPCRIEVARGAVGRATA